MASPRGKSWIITADATGEVYSWIHPEPVAQVIPSGSTWGGATVVLQFKKPNGDWQTVKDTSGNDVSFTSASDAPRIMYVSQLEDLRTVTTGSTNPAIQLGLYAVNLGGRTV